MRVPFLDGEAKRIVASAVRGRKTIVLERLNTLSNLTPKGSIGAWPRVHLGMRVLQFAELSKVAVLQVLPAYTSITCSVCGYADKKNRRGREFVCLSCGVRGHADLLAAQNLVRKATGVFPFEKDVKAGIKYDRSHSSTAPFCGVEKS